MAIRKGRQIEHLVVLGMNHASSSADLRDRLLFTGALLEQGLERIRELPELTEALILSTCNRVEIYGVTATPTRAREALLRFQALFHGVAVEELRDATYFYHCGKAAEHLYGVVSSLDSMVIGETQILGQVKEAYLTAAHMGTTGTYLNKLFHFAIEAGKRVMSDTHINAGLVSVASVAVELAGKILGRLNDASALVIGAGEMSALTARHFSSAGIGTMYFANRTRERAMEMASRFGGIPLALAEFPEILDRCDVVVSSTGSPHYIIHPHQVKAVMAKRRNRPIFLIDIAAPRDIDPSVRRLYNVFAYDIDDLTQVVQKNTGMRAEEIGKAREILTEEIAKYFDWYNSRKVIPTLVTLRKELENMCGEELERYKSALAALPEDGQALVKQFASSLTKKFLRVPSRVLREKAAGEDAVRFADTVADLFDLGGMEGEERRVVDSGQSTDDGRE